MALWANEHFLGALGFGAFLRFLINDYGRFQVSAILIASYIIGGSHELRAYVPLKKEFLVGNRLF